ncbi:MAG: hypothetical protein V2I41_16700 [Pseudomonadales bacterium]|nr:hypothetical protein [Pseudomonadales bacterium]
MTRYLSGMRFLAATLLLAAHSSLWADQPLDLSTPEAAVRAHVAAFTNRDNEMHRQTTSFPVTQHLLEEGPSITLSPDELEDLSESALDIVFVSAQKLDQHNNMAVVRVVFDVTVPQGNTFKAVAWWGVKNDEGQWRVAWRQWLGPLDN